MVYQVFALKWRPQNFEEIIGQSYIVATLKNSLLGYRLAHAYLFAGPRGVGKTSTARILAKSLNCKNGPTINPCQVCPSCIEITECRSLDVIEIDGASNRGIDEIRALRESVRFAPVSGQFKIYIIDEVHMLTNEAFNALLKTLEEPPGFVKFIFATTQPNKIPATILSRCQRLDFQRVPQVEIIIQLEKITAQEKVELEKEVLLTVARASDGSLRDAESILDQLISFTRGNKIGISDVVSVLGVVEQEMLFEITDKIIQKDALATLRLLNDVLRQGKDVSVILNNLIEHFRNLIVAKISQKDPYLIDLPKEILERLYLQSQHFSLEEIFSAFNLLVNTQEMSKKLNSSIIPLEINLIRLTQDKISTPQSKQETKTYIESKAEPDKKCPEPETQPHSMPIEENTLKEIWPKIIDDLSKIKMSIATYLSEGWPANLDNDTLIISFPGHCSLHKEVLERKENKSLIEKSISQTLKKHLKIKFNLSAKDSAQQKGKDDSFVNSALNAFNARLL